MMHMAKCIILLTHPKPFRIPMDFKLQEEDDMWSKFLACVGPTVSMCLHAPLPLQFSFVFIYYATLLNIYPILMSKHHLLASLLKFQMYPSNLGN